jgi:thioredoxin-related protein
MLDKQTYPNTKVVNLAKKLVAVKINPELSEANKSLEKKYKIEGYPTILFVDSKGKKLHEFLGFAPPEVFAGEMQKALSKAKK